MDLAAAAEPGAGSQRLEVRDEVAEKCQKLFLDFLEEFQNSDGEIKYLQLAEELIRPERNTLVVYCPGSAVPQDTRQPKMPSFLNYYTLLLVDSGDKSFQKHCTPRQDSRAY